MASAVRTKSTTEPEGLGRDKDAGKELEAARRELENVPRLTAGLIPRRGIIEPWVDGLHGERLMRAGQHEEARKVLENVARTLRASPGPDAWSQNLFRLESLARSARDADDWDLAALVIWRPPIEPVTIAAQPPRPGDVLTIHGYGQGQYRIATGRCTTYYAPRENFPR